MHSIIDLLQSQCQKTGKKETEIYADIYKLNKKIQSNQAKRNEINQALIPKLKEELNYFT